MGISYLFHSYTVYAYLMLWSIYCE